MSVSGGVATLEGSVRDTWQHALAEDIAHSARGPRRAQSPCGCICGTGQRRRDSLRHSLRDSAFLWTLGAGIKVAVNDRAVVLSGTVAGLPTKERTEHLARHYGALNQS